MADIRVKDLNEAAVPGADYYLLTDSATDGVKKVKTSNIISKSDIGLGNVDNTSDVNKPISTATQSALDGKATAAQGAKADTAVQPGSLGALALKNQAGIADIAATGTPNAVTWLRGDGSWVTPAGGGDMVKTNDLSDVDDKNASLVNLGSTPSFPTFAAAQAYSPKTAPDGIRTLGRDAAGDGGGAAYKKVITEPTHYGKLSITLADGVTIVWYEIAEKEVDPLAMPAIIGTDDTANFMHALEYAEKITLDPRHLYKIHNVLEVSRPIIVDLNKAVVAAAAGITDDNLFKILSSDVRIGGGTLDGTNLPDRTGDFVGADFKSFTVLAQGTSGATLTGVSFDDVLIKAGDTACIAAQYCPGLVAMRMRLDGTNTSAIYSTEALAHLQYCDKMQVEALRMIGIKHKGVAFYTSNDFVAANIIAETISAGEAAIFVGSGASRWTIGDAAVVGGFGAKADGCNYGTFRNLNVNANGVGYGGVMLQGCVETTVDGGEISGFTEYGVSVCSHPLNATPAQDCNVLNMRIHGNGAYLDGSSGVQIAADTTYTNTGTTVRGNFIRSVDKGILSVDPGVSSKIDNIDADGNRFYDCKSFAFYGPALSLDFCGNKVEDSTTLVHVVQTWSAGTGERLKVSNNEMYHVGAAAQGLFVHGDAAAGKQASYNQVEYNNNMGSDGARALYLSLQTNSDRIYQLTATGNNWRGGADASAFFLNNNNTGVFPQVCVTGNSLLYGSSAKQNINFVQTAASGAFNGVVENNLATVVNKPNNI